MSMKLTLTTDEANLLLRCLSASIMDAVEKRAKLEKISIEIETAIKLAAEGKEVAE